MKKAILLVFVFLACSGIQAQPVSNTDELKKMLENSMIVDSALSDKVYSDLIDSLKVKIAAVKRKPENWDKMWKFIVSRINEKDTVVAVWLNNLHIDFKTFQTKDSSKASLGFSYDFNLERARINDRGNTKNGSSVSLDSKGNIAFDKAVNPNDFLNTRLALNFFNSGGGVLLKDMAGINDTLRWLRRKMADYHTADEIVESVEWKRFNNLFTISDSWLLKYDLSAGIESNQDFSKKQYTIGLRLGGGIKSWNPGSRLSKWNLLDYPFAVTRLLTGYDPSFAPSGSTIPTLLLGFDLVNPVKDTIRASVVKELKPYPRINLEAGFRTTLGKSGSRTFYFNCSVKYYAEIGAQQLVKESGLDQFTWFTSSVTSDNGFFISYAYGKLPFDKKADAVYQLGFKCSFE